jgi:hypothetical protein
LRHPALRSRILSCESGVGIMEALIVTVIVAFSAVAFLALTENQSIFLKRTRQVNSRDQLGNFFQGVVRDRTLLLFSSQNAKNHKLKDCLGDAEHGVAPKCEIGKTQPLWLLDLSDPDLKRFWTAPPETPALFDEHGQGCEREKGNYCRFQVSTTFIAYCDNDAKDCKYPSRVVVNLGLKQLPSPDKKITPTILKPLQFTAAHYISYNIAPEIISAPSEILLSAAQPVKNFNILFRRDISEYKILWHICDSSSPEVMIQCVESDSTNAVTITARLATHESGKTHTARFQLSNFGPQPNTSKIIEVPIRILPVCYLPWGAILESGMTSLAYEKAIVAPEEECRPTPIGCDNGKLIGMAKFQNCQRRQPSNCVLPWGEAIAHGQERLAFKNDTVPFGALCTEEIRTCNDGKLSGSGLFQHCITQPALPCSLPWGGTINHGGQVVAFAHQQVPFGQACENSRELRTCQNGVLTGTYNYVNCTVSPPRNCVTPWGSQVAHGQSVPAYFRSTVPAVQSCTSGGNFEQRLCQDGTLGGNFGNASCSVLPPI